MLVGALEVVARRRAHVERGVGAAGAASASSSRALCPLSPHYFQQARNLSSRNIETTQVIDEAGLFLR
jgi:hypothetical protein